MSYWRGGSGPPRLTVALGKIKEFHDGAGLTSPGRWPKERRVFPTNNIVDSIRKDLLKLVEDHFGSIRRDRLFFEIMAKQTVFDDT